MGLLSTSFKKHIIPFKSLPILATFLYKAFAVHLWSMLVNVLEWRLSTPLSSMWATSQRTETFSAFFGYQFRWLIGSDTVTSFPIKVFTSVNCNLTKHRGNCSLLLFPIFDSFTITVIHQPDRTSTRLNSSHL